MDTRKCRRDSDGLKAPWPTTRRASVSDSANTGARATARGVGRSPPAARSAPPWVRLSGFAGAIYVFTATAFAPRLGAATFTAAVVAGQLVAGGALVLQQSATTK